MDRRFAIVRLMKRYPETQFHGSFARITNMIVTQREYERLYGYDAFRIVFQSDDYDNCLNVLNKMKEPIKFQLCTKTGISQQRRVT